MLVTEVLDGLVVEQAVDGARVRFLVRFVHLPAVLDSPLGDAERVGRVADDTDERHERIGRTEEAPENAANQRDLDQRRHDVEQHEREQRVDAVRAALDRARQATRLALEMELQRQLMQVPKSLQRDIADGALSDLREHRVA